MKVGNIDLKWNRKTKKYDYKGHEIAPFPVEKIRETPARMITAYYNEEIRRIDAIAAE